MTFFYGPLNKSIHTQELELFAKSLLAQPDIIHFGYQEIDGKKQLYGYAGSENPIPVNISNLLKKADFTHIHLSETDSQAYLKHYIGDRRDNSLEDPKPTPIDKLITPAEKSAIQSYTGSGYASINRLMYQNGVVHHSIGSKTAENAIAFDILKMLFISSGLNKIMPEITDTPAYTYRGEHSTTAEQIQNRIDSMHSEDGFTKMPAYLSTTSDPYIATSFSGNVMIKFEGLYGKSIENISHFESEQEYLLQPVKIQWTDYQEKQRPKYYGSEETRTVYEFKAKVVAPLIPGEGEPTPEEAAEFKKIVEWAKNNHIDTDFITEHNKNQYLLDESPLLGMAEKDFYISSHPFDYLDEVVENIYIPSSLLDCLDEIVEPIVNTLF